MAFYERVSPVFAGEKCLIPAPTLCGECRETRRLAWRNRKKVFKRTCALTGATIFSQFSSASPLIVYRAKEWEGDVFDPLSYGRDFDFSRGFFEQFAELYYATPAPHASVQEDTLENAEYVNGAIHVKNAYLCGNIVSCENVYYSQAIYNSKNCSDCLYVDHCEECYECSNSDTLTKCSYCHDCINCFDCGYCQSCQGCTSCIGCIGLVNQQYYIYNVPHTRDKYLRIRASLPSDEIRARVSALSPTVPRKYANILSCEDCTGDYITNSKHCHDSYDIKEGENIRYSLFVVEKCHDIWDVSFWGQYMEYCYESTASGFYAKNILFSVDSWNNVSNLAYCINCYPNVSDCFGCVGIRNRRFCVFNQQYAQKEYEALVPRIIEHMRTLGEWGEFFPVSLSPLGYNETDIYMNRPLTRDEALARGFRWSDYEPPFPKVERIIPANKLPASIEDIPDDILNWAIQCEVTGKPFRIVKQELDFYRKYHLPIPRRHPDRRHLDRMALRNPRKLYTRKCDKCGIEMQTTYAPERPERVYCEACYNREVYG